jgi:membrane protease YdiL (CAAX protease family)
VSHVLLDHDAGWTALLALLSAVWSLLLAPALVPPALRDACLVACCAAALGLLLATGPRISCGRLSGGCAPVLLGLALAVVSYPAWIASIDGVGRALGLPAPPVVPPAQLSAASWLTVVALGPILGEIIYRGRVLPFVARRAGRPAAVLASTALFSAAHSGPWLVLVTAVAGLALGMLRVATGSVAAGIGLHAGLNLGGALFGAPPLRHPLPAPAACLAGAVALAALLLASRPGRPRGERGLAHA